MIANRELGMDDYLAICRRRLRVVLIPAPIALVLGFLISFALTPKYTSSSLLLVEGQVVPTGYVKPIITERVSDRMATLAQSVLSRNRLAPLVNSLGLARSGKSVDAVIEEIRKNVQVTAADPNAPPPGSTSSSSSKSSSSTPSLTRKPVPGETDDVPGFYVSFTADNPRDAQQVCAGITSLLLQENLELREEVAQSTTDFLSKQLEQAKLNLDDLDKRLSEFKQLHLGRLPSDEDKNLKILAALNSELDANTQTLNRAQQDKSFAESLLGQQTAVWESLQASPNLPPLREQLVTLQNQLVLLQARYTEDYPDVVKIKSDIAQLKAKLKEADSSPANSNAPGTAAGSVAVKMEPPEILRLRQQVHQDEDVILRASLQQKRLSQLIDSYQSRLALSPEIEEQYKQLTRDNEGAHKIYDDLTANKNAAEMQTEMERKQQGEQMKLLNPANLPDSPSFPVRWMFAAGGLGAGLGIGLMVALWLELRDKSIRDEGDVLAALELPMLVSVPWVGAEKERGKGKLWERFRPFRRERKTA
jgi:uncharacterized protein involved in exopolysaccharide biosynthesis